MCEKKKLEPIGLPNVETWRTAAKAWVEDLRKLLNTMPSKGDREEDCQRLCLHNALNNFDRHVNGTEQEDMENWTEAQHELLTAMIKRGWAVGAEECASAWIAGGENVPDVFLVGHPEFKGLVAHCNSDARNKVMA